MSSIGLADAPVVRAAARPPRHHRQRAAAVRLDAARLSDHRRQRTDARRARRARRRDRRLSRVWSATTTRDARSSARALHAPTCRRRHRVRRIERRHRGSRADARRRTRRAGRARHRDAAEQPDRHGPNRTAADLPAARQPGLGALRLRLLRRPRDSRARRPTEGTGRTDRCARRSRARSARRSAASTTRASALEEGSVEPLSVAGASVLSSTTRADGFVIVDDDSEGFAAGTERRRLALCVSQEQFLQVLDRDEAERRFRAAIDLAPRGIERVALDAGARPRPRGRRRLTRGRAVVRSLERRWLCRGRRGHVRRVGRSPAPRAPRRRSHSHRRRADDDRSIRRGRRDRHRRHDAARRRRGRDGRARRRSVWL